MSLIQGDRNRVVFAAYDAVTDPARWGEALDLAVGYLGAQAAALNIRQEMIAAPYAVAHLSALYRDWLPTPPGQVYLNELLQLEAQDWASWEQRAPRTVVCDADLSDYPVAARDARPDYISLRENCGVRRRLGFRFNTEKGWFEAIAIGFRQGQVDQLKHLYPYMHSVMMHYAKAIELSRAFNLLRARYRAVFGFLDRLPFGVAICLGDGQVIVANAEANRIFEEADALRLDPQKRIRPAGDNEYPSLRSLIARSAKTVAGESDGAGDVIQMPRRSGARDMLVEVAPLAESSRELGQVFEGAMILMIDPDRPPRLDLATFARLNGLTKAEEEICGLLTQGKDTADIADIRSTSMVTTRNQIKAIFSKVGVRSRAALLLLLLRSFPPIA